jgi:hypothetical protein
MTVVSTVTSFCPTFVSYLIVMFRKIFKFLIMLPIYSCLMLHYQGNEEQEGYRR